MRILKKMQEIFGKKIDQFLLTLMLVILALLLFFDINTLITKDYRKLNSLQKDIIYEKISKDPNTTVKIIRYDDSEIKQFAEQFKKLFQNANWRTIEIIKRKDKNDLKWGITLCVPNLHKYRPEMMALEQGLCNAKIEIYIDEDLEYDTEELSIFVGLKENKKL